jgi:hypothetical protein
MIETEKNLPTLVVESVNMNFDRLSLKTSKRDRERILKLALNDHLSFSRISELTGFKVEDIIGIVNQGYYESSRKKLSKPEDTRPDRLRKKRESFVSDFHSSIDSQFMRKLLELLSLAVRRLGRYNDQNFVRIAATNLRKLVVEHYQQLYLYDAKNLITQACHITERQFFLASLRGEVPYDGRFVKTVKKK